MSQPARIDPLDALFRPTSRPSSIGSAAPIRTLGTHTRAGNAMNRTRAALLAGARLAVERSGTRITMAQVAISAGVAKATLYNHFRTRDAVLAALLEHELATVIEAASGQPLDRSLASAAATIAEHPVVRGLADVEPATLARIARVDRRASGWRVAHEAVTAHLLDAGFEGSEIVLRWLASYLLTPASRSAIEADVQILLAGLPARRAATESLSNSEPARSS